MKNKAAQQIGRLGGKAKTKAKTSAARANGAAGGRPLSPQVVARLEWVSHLASWLNVHDEMKPIVVGLMRRGLVVREKGDNALYLSEKGEAMLEKAGKPSAPVAGAKYRQDRWPQDIPC